MGSKANYFEHLFQSIPAGVVLLDKDDRIIDFNEGFKELFKFEKEEAIGKKINDLIVPDHLKDEGSGATKTVASGGRLFVETTRKTKEGQLLQVSITGSPIALQSDSLSIIGIYQDITSRKQAEEALRESEEKLRTIFDHANIGFSIVAKSGEFVLTNKWHQDFLGYGKNDGSPLSIMDITHPDDVEETKKRFAALVLGEIDNYRIEKRFVRHDGEVVWVDLSVSGLRDQHGKVTMIIGMVVDINEKKQAEMVLKHSEQQLKDMNATKDTLISILSHDLRSPFTSIIGLTDIVLDNMAAYSRAEVKEHLQGIRSRGTATLTLLDDILSWIKVQSGKMSFHPDIVNFSAACESVVRSFHPLALTKEILINCSAVSDLEAYTDERMLQTIMRNLISNAIKFTPEKGTIRIAAVSDSRSVLVSVSDSGVGIEPDKITRLWNITSHHTTRGTAGEEGSGYGLVLCRELVEKQGGRIWVESEVGKGTTFYFTIPQTTSK